jgi:hypothetical protein
VTASQRMGRPVTPDLDPVFVALNRDELPVRARSGGELAARVRRAEDYAVLGAWWWSCTAKATPTCPPPGLGDHRRAHRIHRLAGQRATRGERCHTDRADRTRRSWKSQPREMAADPANLHSRNSLTKRAAMRWPPMLLGVRRAVGALYVQLVGTDTPPAALAARWMARWLAEHDDQESTGPVCRRLLWHGNSYGSLSTGITAYLHPSTPPPAYRPWWQARSRLLA